MKDVRFASFDHSEIVRLTLLIASVLVAAASEASNVADVVSDRRQYAVDAYFDAQWCIASAMKSAHAAVVAMKAETGADALRVANTKLLSAVDVTIQSTYANVTYAELAKKPGTVVEIVARADRVARHSVMNGFKFTMDSAIAKDDRVWPPYDFGCRCRAKPSSGAPSKIVPDGGRRPGFSGGPNHPRDGRSAVVAQFGPRFNDRVKLTRVDDDLVDLTAYEATDKELAFATREMNEGNFDNYFTPSRTHGVLESITESERKAFPQLSRVEAAMLVDYSCQGFYEMNQSLRMTGGVNSEMFNNALRAKVTASALHKMPKYNGVVYRGTPVPKAMRHSVGDVFSDSGFMSTSKDMKFVEEYGFANVGSAGSDYTPTFYTIKSKRGVHLGKLQRIDVEEVLFAPGSSFKVTGISTETREVPTWFGLSRKMVRVDIVTMEEI